ncbi:hypothetical protein FHW94_003593 [Novosphingobium sp. SG720]|nr:hypothetical protein [Novosphingobium sp. SG720]
MASPKAGRFEFGRGCLKGLLQMGEIGAWCKCEGSKDSCAVCNYALNLI